MDRFKHNIAPAPCADNVALNTIFHTIKPKKVKIDSRKNFKTGIAEVIAICNEMIDNARESLNHG